jgi:hypothetical protein
MTALDAPRCEIVHREVACHRLLATGKEVFQGFCRRPMQTGPATWTPATGNRFPDDPVGEVVLFRPPARWAQEVAGERLVDRIEQVLFVKSGHRAEDLEVESVGKNGGNAQHALRLPGQPGESQAHHLANRRWNATVQNVQCRIACG